MSAASNRPRGLDLVAIAQVLEHLASELRKRADNLEGRVDDLGGPPQCGLRDEEAETRVDALLAPLTNGCEGGESEGGKLLRHPAADVHGIDPLLGVSELAKVLNVSPKTIRGWRAGKQIPEAITIGGSLRWRRSAVESWLAQKGGAA